MQRDCKIDLERETERERERERERETINNVTIFESECVIACIVNHIWTTKYDLPLTLAMKSSETVSVLLVANDQRLRRLLITVSMHNLILLRCYTPIHYCSPSYMVLRIAVLFALYVQTFVLLSTALHTLALNCHTCPISHYHLSSFSISHTSVSRFPFPYVQ